jgi:kynurenine formamidase
MGSILGFLPLQAAEPTYDAAFVAKVHKEISNWGRWGEDDQLGTLNLITPAKRVAAAKLVREGISVSMAHALFKEPTKDSPSPFEHEMVGIPNDQSDWAVDKIGVVFHGLGHTHIDAICHLGHEGAYYNGFPISGTTAAGCANNGIEHIAQGIFTRAILMDIPRLKGVEWLEPGTPVMPADLEAWEKKAGVKVGPGDAVLVHTGRWVKRAAEGPWDGGYAGLHVTTAQWLKERDAATVGTDGGLDVYPSGVAGVGAPVHVLVLSSLGMPILDTMDLTDAAETAARLGRWEFLLTAAPLRVEGGTGSPMNFIATF